ncbi:MAG: glycosyltransferase family 2 protein [Planctomycetaceae bacterium]
MNRQDRLFSVIIPTYARPRQLANCLESLTRLDAPAGGFEVIVVDDGGPQPLDSVVAPYLDRMNLTLLRQANGGPGMARNTGAQASRGQYLAFTDDDCLPDRNWLIALACGFQRTPENLLGGRTVNHLVQNPYSTASQVIVDVAYAFFNANPNAARFFASNNIAVPASSFFALGGFEGQRFRVASEDRDFCSRWLQRGQQMTYVPEACVLHAHDLTLPTFCRQHFAYGRGALLFHRARRERRAGRLRDEWGVHARLPLLLGGPLSKLPAGQALKTLALLPVWQAANAAGFLYEACRSRRETLNGDARCT